MTGKRKKSREDWAYEIGSWIVAVAFVYGMVRLFVWLLP